MSEPASKGVVDGRLAACPGTPNCVNSETPDESIAPLEFEGPAERAWQAAAEAVAGTGGHVVTADETYLHATYTSRVFRFVDDLELRLDAEASVIHVRSASRIGYSDLGANRRRVERLREAFEKARKI
jgi:uncharacterized protein (DUF1499 family)